MKIDEPAQQVNAADFRALERALEILKKAKIQLSVQSYTGTWGLSDLSDIMTVIQGGSAAYAAPREGVTPQEYKDFAEAAGMIFCCAQTKAGKPCRSVKAGQHYKPKEWLAELGWKCRAHEDAGS